MKSAAIRNLREKLRADQAVCGLWINLEDATVSEMAAALGLDWIIIDTEHGHLDWKEVVGHIRSTAGTDTVALVRIAELNAGLIKRVLDIGADGVVVPWVETAEQLDRAVVYAMYPPEGVRGIGADRATGWGESLAEHAREANEHVLVVPIIETVRAGKNIQELSRCKVAEIFYFGPADYSASAGYRGQWEGPNVAAEILACKDVLRAAGKFCGIQANGHANLVERRLQGFRMLGIGSDTGLLLQGLHGALGVVGRDRRIVCSLAPDSPLLPAMARLPRPPESFRPDRPEMISAPRTNAPVALGPGVMFDCQAGAYNRARGLTTGLVVFEPNARLAYHTHTFGESITALDGPLNVAVEGREYHLGPLDNIVVRRGLAHTAWNPSASSRATAHVALASDTPARELVSTRFEESTMPKDFTGIPGKERLTPIAIATRTVVGSGTSFIDHCNRSLMPEIEMSGGYATFEPGGRLPAHFHDFDESICIIEGSAICVVEGRRYPMSGCATALQPRGRVHYFINESKGRMAMIWYYAGPMPERVVVEESCATAEGDPWKS